LDAIPRTISAPLKKAFYVTPNDVIDQGFAAEVLHSREPLITILTAQCLLNTLRLYKKSM